MLVKEGYLYCQQQMVLVNDAYWCVCVHMPQILIASKVWIFNHIYWLIAVTLYQCSNHDIQHFFVTGITLTFSHNFGYHYNLHKHRAYPCKWLCYTTTSDCLILECSVNSYVWCAIFCILDMWLLLPRWIEMIILSVSWEFYAFERGIECECDPKY